MNNNPRIKRANTSFATDFPLINKSGRVFDESDDGNTLIDHGVFTPLSENPGYTHRTGSTADDQPRHNREPHPVDEHQALVQKHHAAALVDMKRRLKAEANKRYDDACDRLWAAMHPDAGPLEAEQ